MKTISQEIKDWANKLSTQFGKRSINIAPNDVMMAADALFAKLKKDGKTLDDVSTESNIKKIIKHCLPQDKSLIHQKWVWKVTKDVSTSLENFYENSNIDVEQLTEKVCKEIGVKYKERKTEKKPSVSEYLDLSSEEIEDLKIKVKPSESEQKSGDIIDLANKSRTKIRPELFADLAPPIDPEMAEFFGINEKGEIE